MLTASRSRSTTLVNKHSRWAGRLDSRLSLEVRQTQTIVVRESQRETGVLVVQGENETPDEAVA
jgi:hypothetical protein